MPFGKDRDERRNERVSKHYHYYIADPRLMERLDQVLKALEGIGEVAKLTADLKKANDAEAAAIQAGTPPAQPTPPSA